MCNGTGILHFGLFGEFLMELEDYADLRLSYDGMLVCDAGGEAIDFSTNYHGMMLAKVVYQTFLSHTNIKKSSMVKWYQLPVL